MAVNREFLAYVSEQLSGCGRIASRSMFGGAGLYADDLFFALIADDTLYFKVDDSNRGEYLSRGSKPFCPFPDKSETSMNYYDVPADLLDDAEELCVWARKSIAIARHAAIAKSLPKRRKSPPKSTRKR
jgi:DNA transformation protein